jgi:drug/metabolite transporter (DMT)-like permease
MASRPYTRSQLIAVSLALILIWGSAFNFVGVAVDHISPNWLVGWRLCIAAVLLTVWTYATGQRLPPLRDTRWVWYGGLGLSGAVIPFLLMAYGQLTVDSGLTAVIVGAMPLITILLAHFFTDEKLTVMKVLGFVIGFLGVAVLFLPDNFAVGLTRDWIPQLVILAAAFCYAFTTVAAKRAPETNAVVGSAIMMIIAAIAGVASAQILDPGGHVPDAMALIMIILLGLGSTGVATILYLDFVDRAGPSAMARLNYFPPVVSVIFGVWFLSEPFTWKLIAAFVIIVIGMMVSRLKSSRSPTPSTPQTD